MRLRNRNGRSLNLSPVGPFHRTPSARPRDCESLGEHRLKMEQCLNRKWRASLVPAAATILSPLAYIKVAAVKKLVVGSRDVPPRFPSCHASQGVVVRRGRWGLIQRVSGILLGLSSVMARRCVWVGVLNWMPASLRDHFTLNKSECSKQAPPRSNGSAWNNGRGPASASVGLTEAGNDQEERTGAEVWHGER